MNSRITLLTTLSLVLAACGQPGTTAPPSTPPSTGGPVISQPHQPGAEPGTVYEVRFQSANGQAVTAVPCR